MSIPLSIITINYNNDKGLLKTIKSVINQSLKSFEYIVIDGCSTDKSVSLLMENSVHINYWVSEKDNGIYHAINKGIKVARGNYIFFLNSGDCLINDKIIEDSLPLIHTEDIIYGNLLIDTSEKQWVKEYPDILTFSHFFYDSLPHSGGSFFKKDIFQNGRKGFDENLKIVSDWKFYLISIFKLNNTYRHIAKTVSVFDYTGISAVNSTLLQQEKNEVLKKEFNEIFAEISQLLSFKTKYQTLLSSRALKTYFRFKKLFKSGNDHN